MLTFCWVLSFRWFLLQKVGNFSMRGEFLQHCDYLGAPFKRRTIENFIRQKIDGNWIPPPDQGVFQDSWAKNTATLLARIKALLK